MSGIRFLLRLVCASFAAPLFAATLTVGNEVASPSSSDGNVGVTRTDVDLVHAATHSGSVNTAKVYVDPSLAADEEIAFNAGSHTELIRMRYSDFERLVHPRIASLVVA